MCVRMVLSIGVVNMGYDNEYVSDPRERFIDQRVDKFCEQGMDYWQAVKVAEKQADYIERYKGVFPN